MSFNDPKDNQNNDPPRAGFKGDPAIVRRAPSPTSDTEGRAFGEDGVARDSPDQIRDAAATDVGTGDSSEIDPISSPPHYPVYNPQPN